MRRILSSLQFLALLLVAFAARAADKPAPLAGQFRAWRHSGSIFILTTPDGADLPASVSEDGFPLLVRLNNDFFDFSEAKPKGDDLRFSTAADVSLPYQIEQWDVPGGAASIWVRIPVIHGNARQEIRLHWGNADAAGESNGAAVFNASNGYLSVLHLGDSANPVKDETGLLLPVDRGTTDCAGIIGRGRRFVAGRGIKGGEGILHFPTGNSEHSTEAWIKAERANATIVGWGNEKAQGKVTMQLVSPPHLRMDCYFSDGNVSGDSPVPLSRWIHVAHTYRKGEARVYVNGRLDGIAKLAGSPLAIESPAKMWIGGWYDNYNFVGDIDEVRISKVARSAAWIKLEYENQKKLQTLVGTLVRPGNRPVSVSPAEIKIDEGQSATAAGQADGAQKVYWIIKRGGAETIVAVDRISYRLVAGRVPADESFVLRLKAVYPDAIKTNDIPVSIKKMIPEPDFALEAPAAWNGRDTVAVVPVIRNLAAMQAKGAADLHYAWTISGGAVIKEIVPGKLILKRSQYTGPIVVKVAINNGGADTNASAIIQVAEPKHDPWIRRIAAIDEKPEDNQFFARDDRNEGTLFYNGTLDRAADSVFLKVFADGKLIETESHPLAADRRYAFTVKLKPGLIHYSATFGSKTGGAERVLHTASRLVCGDAYIIQGQSNALATDTAEQSPPTTSEWIRSYGNPTDRSGGVRKNLWCSPVWKARNNEQTELGYWGMELAKRLVESQKIPICIINGAVGGTRIDQHQRNEANHGDLTTIYGRTLWRVRQARLTHGIRGILWHQGENDQGADGPTGRYGWETYQQYFVDLSAAWKQDYPNVQHYYIFQIWPNACSMGGSRGSGDMLREMQRTLPRLYSNMRIMSTLGIQPPGGCHYPLAGWAEFARLLCPLIERDNYGKTFPISITPPNLRRAYYTSRKQDEIGLEFDQPVVWDKPLVSQFYLEGAAEKVRSGVAASNVITLELTAGSTATKITYLKERDWNPNNLLRGTNGITALTFCNVPILPHQAIQGRASPGGPGSQEAARDQR